MNILSTEESKKYELNMECEEKIRITYLLLIQKDNTKTKNNFNDRQTFVEMLPILRTEHFGRHNHKNLSKKKPNCDQLKAFIRVRQKPIKNKKGHQVYTSLHGIKKEALTDICMDVKHNPIKKRSYTVEEKCVRTEIDIQ